jgi:hypothetical protein
MPEDNTMFGLLVLSGPEKPAEVADLLRISVGTVERDLADALVEVRPPCVSPDALLAASAADQNVHWEMP